MRTPEKPTVVFDIDLVFAWSVGIYRGLVDAPEADRWRVVLGIYQGNRLINCRAELQRGEGWTFSAVVTGDSELVELCRRRGVACVQIGIQSAPTESAGICPIATDYGEMGAMAARELIRLGYTQATAVGGREGSTAVEHLKGAGFRGELVARLGERAWVEPPPVEVLGGWLDNSSLGSLADWLAARDGPLGVAATNVRLAWEVARAIRQAGRRIPADFALIALGDDPLLLGQAQPTLSGVAEDGLAIGAAAAEEVARQLSARQTCAQRWVKPLGVVRRASTDHFLNPDPVVQKALRIIWKETEEALDVNALARAVHVSRATLLRRFQQYRGHPPAQEIQEARMRRALLWISHSDLAMTEIAERCGYSLLSAFSHAIRKATGHSPSELRRRARGALHPPGTGGRWPSGGGPG